MRTLKKNKQKMYYALFDGEKPVYEMEAYANFPGDLIPSEELLPLNENTENPVCIEVDGEMVLVETGETELFYCVPVLFKGNIAMSGGESKQVEFGVDKGDYDAVLITNRNEFPITETSLIWYESPVVYKDEEKKIVDGNSADYRVKKVSPSLNQTKYLLERIIK